MTENSSLHIVEQLAEDFFKRNRNGDSISPEEFAAQFPEHSATLQDFIAAMSMVRDARIASEREPGIAPGEYLGQYRVIDEIGRGGMGLVYAATDLRLDRKVALKLLSETYTNDQEWLHRFYREAKLASSLNHPNILTIHEIGNDGDRPFIATEFVEGTTLLELLRTNPPHVNQSLDFATQLASAISTAHSAGIVHRDLKPENVMVRSDGIVKVLDFGLAKTTTPKDDRDATSPTSPGLVLGTVHYMSPEQARGLRIESSSDIFSFGILCYVMLTGEHPFAGETPSDVMAGIISQNPQPFAQSLSEIPESVRRLVIDCLHKQPERRPTADELLQQLRNVARQAPPPASVPSTMPEQIERSTSWQVTASATTRIENICYARSGDVNIAWQTLGDGPIDLVFVMGWVSHLEWFWKEPSFSSFLHRLAKFSRVILFDKRGTGLSDKVPVNELPTLEQRMDDVRAVMEAARSKRAVLCGVSEGGPLCTLFAATYPEKTIALTMIGCYARRLWAEDYPWGPTADQREIFLKEIERNWGGPLGIEDRAPSKASDPDFRDWWASYLRMGASPGAAVALTRMNAQIDVRPILPTIQVPSLVIHRSGDRCLLVEEGRYLASQIPAAKFVELPGDDHLPFVGDSDAVLDEIEEFLTGKRQATASNRVLTTTLCIQSTSPLDSAIDHDLSELERFAGMVEREAALFQGNNLTRDADRLLLTFDGPARAVRAARAITELAVRSKVHVQCGVHTGICEIEKDSLHGPAVDVSRELAEQAEEGQVLLSGDVKNLISGSGLEFSELHPSDRAQGISIFRLKP